MAQFYFDVFDMTNSNWIEDIKPQFTPNPRLRKFKMGEVFFLINIYNHCDHFTIKKVMVANFVNLQQPIVHLKLTQLDDTQETMNMAFTQAYIPTYGQKKDTILLGDNTVFCTDKQAVLNFIKTRLKKGNFTLKQYLDYNMRSSNQDKLIQTYKETIKLLKTI